MNVVINNIDYCKQSFDVRVVDGIKDDFISGVNEVYIGKNRLNVPSYSLQCLDCSAYAVGITLDGRKVLMVSP